MEVCDAGHRPGKIDARMEMLFFLSSNVHLGGVTSIMLLESRIFCIFWEGRVFKALLEAKGYLQVQVIPIDFSKLLLLSIGFEGNNIIAYLFSFVIGQEYREHIPRRNMQ